MRWPGLSDDAKLSPASRAVISAKISPPGRPTASDSYHDAIARQYGIASRSRYPSLSLRSSAVEPATIPPRAQFPPHSPMAAMAASPSSRRRDDGLRNPTATSSPDEKTAWKLSGSPPHGTT